MHSRDTRTVYWGKGRDKWERKQIEYKNEEQMIKVQYNKW
jgi:hypothetical protein